MFGDSDLSLQQREGLQRYLDETGIITNTRVKNPVCSESPRAIVGTTLHVHVTHRKLFINETPPPYYCSKISCPTRDTLLTSLCSREDARRVTDAFRQLYNYAKRTPLESKIPRYYITIPNFDYNRANSLVFVSLC